MQLPCSSCLGSTCMQTRAMQHSAGQCSTVQYSWVTHGAAQCTDRHVKNGVVCRLHMSDRHMPSDRAADAQSSRNGKRSRCALFDIASAYITENRTYTCFPPQGYICQKPLVCLEGRDSNTRVLSPGHCKVRYYDGQMQGAKIQASIECMLDLQ